MQAYFNVIIKHRSLMAPVSLRELGVGWAVLIPHLNLFKNYMFFAAYHLSEWGNTKITCSIFVSPQNNKISDMSVLFQ